MKSIFTGFMIAMSFSSAFAAKPTDGLPASVLKIHNAIAAQDCDASLEQASDSFDLGNGNTLYLVPCTMGAYQGSSKAYLAAKDFVSQVTVLAKEGTALVGTQDLTSADFDAKTGLLSTFTKGRGIGDCGQSSQTKISTDKYGSVNIKTIEIRSKDACDGKYVDTWPVVFKQK